MSDEPQSHGWRELWASVREAFLFTRGRLELDPVRDLNRLQRFIATNLRVIFLVFRIDVYRRVELHAQALTMKTLLSLVPLAVVVFAVLSAFGGGMESANRDLIEMIIGYLSGSEQLQTTLSEYLNSQSIHEAELGALTIIILAVTVMSLLSHVENSFNTLFGVATHRRIGVRLLSYWALLTLGPLLLLISIALTAGLQSSGLGQQLDTLGGLGSFALRSAPIVVGWFAFTVLYLTVPNTRVQFVPALLASMVAGSMWNVAKYLFAWYARNNVTVQDIYGSLSALPLFILWVYFSWVFVLAGAQLCFAFQHAATYQPGRTGQEITFRALERAVVRLFFEVARDFQLGRQPTLAASAASRLGIPGYLEEHAVGQLRSGEFVLDTQGGGLVPARDLGQIRVCDLLDYISRGNAAVAEHRNDEPGLYFKDLFRQLDSRRNEVAGTETFRELINRFTDPEPAEEPPRIGLAKDS